MYMVKKITNIGNCAGLIIDKTIKEMSGIQMGDMVEIKSTKNKIIITKINKEEK